MAQATKERSGSELAFSILRTLMVSYRLWGRRGEVTAADLALLLDVPEDCLDEVLAVLLGERLVTKGREHRAYALSEQGALQLLR